MRITSDPEEDDAVGGEPSYVSMCATDADGVVETIVVLVGKEPDDIYASITYLDRMISVHGKLPTNF